jgi:hypothetical protein
MRLYLLLFIHRFLIQSRSNLGDEDLNWEYSYIFQPIPPNQGIELLWFTGREQMRGIFRKDLLP